MLVSEGTAVCQNPKAGSKGGPLERGHSLCGSRAFYRGEGAKPARHIMGGPLPDDDVPAIAEAPYPARRTHHGHRNP